MIEHTQYMCLCYLEATLLVEPEFKYLSYLHYQYYYLLSSKTYPCDMIGFVLIIKSK